MRHTLHLAIGSNLTNLICDIKRYIIKYGSEDEKRYFRAMLFAQSDGHDAFFETLTDEADESVFVAGIDNLFSVSPADYAEIPDKGRTEHLRACFTRMFTERVNINFPSDSNMLHVCIYLPLYDERYWSQAKELIAAMDAADPQFCVDLFMLPYDMAGLIEEDTAELATKQSEYELTTAKILREVVAYKKKSASLAHMLFMQNFNAAGLSLDLNTDSLVRIIGEYALASVSHYTDLFNISADEKELPIHALGLSVLSFDKYYFVQYLLHKAYMYILDREQVTQTEVDVNKVSKIIQDLLRGNINIFSDFYTRHIQPRLEQHMSHEDIIAQIRPDLNATIDRLTADFQSYIDEDKYSLPEKKAALAQLLGEDDELLTGYMFNKKQLVIDDCSREVLDFFVEQNNLLWALHDEEDEQDSEAEKERKKAVNAIAECAVLSTETELPVEKPSVMIDELKDIRVSMRESSAYIRQKSLEVEGLDSELRDNIESQKRLTAEGFVFDGNLYQLQTGIVETPLQDTYKPKPVTEKRIDLRQNFTPVKDQGKMGACTAFSLVGIYEYILKKNNSVEADLSERFCYYNVRKMHNQTGEDCGSSLSDMIQTMATEGIASESACPYSEDCTLAPDEAAYADGETRRVVKALNVASRIEDLKSALAEGYPVAGSFRIFDSFTPQDGFISRPTEEEIQSGDSGNHAMIICGYSDDEKIFIVRNSWGQNFGDKGYCYMPYSYATEFLNMACIITEINIAEFTVAGADTKTTIPFDLSNSRIKAAILRVLIDEEKQTLRRLSAVWHEKNLQYNKLFQAVGNNSTRTALMEGTELRLNKERRELTEQKEQLQRERVKEMEAFKKKTLKMIIGFSLSIVAVVAVYVTLCLLTFYLPSFIRISLRHIFLNNYSYAAYAGTLIDIIVFIFTVWKRKHDLVQLDLDYQERIEQLAKQADDRRRQLEVLHLRSHVAGMITDSLARLLHNLHSKYNGMRSYVGNLATWRTEETTAAVMSDNVHEPFLSLISNTCLDRYFAAHKDDITNDIRLYTMFKNSYLIEEQHIIAFKNHLKKQLLMCLAKRLDGFSIYKHVVGEETYPYVERNYTDLNALLQKMDNKAMPFAALHSAPETVASQNASCKLLFLDADFHSERQKWAAICNANFQEAPVLCNGSSPFRLTLLTLKAVSPKDLKTLKST